MKRWTNGLPGATTRLGAMMAHRGLTASQPRCARIPMMVRSKRCSTKRPDTLMQLSRSSLSEIRLAPRGRAIHYGTKLPIPNVRSSVVNGGKADKICSMRVLRILTRIGHSEPSSRSPYRAVMGGSIFWTVPLGGDGGVMDEVAWRVPSEATRGTRCWMPLRMAALLY
jgi:hypothetical protein